MDCSSSDNGNETALQSDDHKTVSAFYVDAEYTIVDVTVTDGSFRKESLRPGTKAALVITAYEKAQGTGDSTGTLKTYAFANAVVRPNIRQGIPSQGAQTMVISFYAFDPAGVSQIVYG